MLPRDALRLEEENKQPAVRPAEYVIIALLIALFVVAVV